MRVALVFSALTAVAFASSVVPAAANDAALSQRFRDAFIDGCLQSKDRSVKNRSGFCGCLADGYQARYSGSELSAISEYARVHKQEGASLVGLMMSPESKACAARY